MGRNRPRLTALLWREPGVFPFPDWEPHLKSMVLQALVHAWSKLLEEAQETGACLLEEQEPAITTRLENALNAIQAQPEHPSGFAASLFQTVVRGAEVTSYDSNTLEKRPDLTFRLISVRPGVDRSLAGLFVECKLVGPDHSVQIYGRQGIHRFICGDYAWAMPSGMMVGYSHQGYSIAQHLVPHLQDASNSELNTRRVQRFVTAPPDLAVYESSHERTWSYPADSRSPGEIALLHLWLPLPSA